MLSLIMPTPYGLIERIQILGCKHAFINPFWVTPTPHKTYVLCGVDNTWSTLNTFTNIHIAFMQVLIVKWIIVTQRVLTKVVI